MIFNFFDLRKTIYPVKHQLNNYFYLRTSSVNKTCMDLYMLRNVQLYSHNVAMGNSSQMTSFISAKCFYQKMNLKKIICILSNWKVFYEFAPVQKHCNLPLIIQASKLFNTILGSYRKVNKSLIGFLLSTFPKVQINFASKNQVQI